MKLWEINSAIMDCVDMETGEIIDIERLDALQMARDEKLENIGLYIKHLDAEASAIREEEKALAARRKVRENKAERLREYLSYSLAGQAFETPRVSVSFRASTRCEVTDETALLDWLHAYDHDDCLKYTAPTVDKTKVTRLLKDGAEIPGAVLEQRQNMQLK